MSQRRLDRIGVLLLSFLVAALVVGAVWRSLSSPGETAAPFAPTPEETPAAAPVELVRHLEIPAGWRAEQIAGALENGGLGDGGRFMALVRAPGWARAVGPHWTGLRSLEGYLFPGIYDLRDGFSERSLLEEMLARFDEAFTPALERRARALGLTRAEVVNLASIVQREMVFESEAPVIAAVYRNRLRARMPLQADPTVIYALESLENEVGDRYWRRGLSRSNLLLDSSYNTYRRVGLPPAPIASPSRDALTAVLFPATFDYRYFVSRGDNTHRFARDYREHLANVRRYRTREVTTSSSGTHLQELVEQVVLPVPARTGILVKNLATGETASKNADEFFTAASLYKLAVMWKAFEERERGRLSFDERLSISADAAAKDGPEIAARLGRRPTVRKALREMIVVSSNAAGVTLLRKLGKQKVERLLRSHGVRETSLSSHRLVTTPRDVARLLELVATGSAVDGEASREMLAILEDQRIRDRLPKYLPKDARLAHKTGNIDYPSHDAGILYTRAGPILIVAMTETARRPAEATEAIAELGRVVFDYFEHYRPVAKRATSEVARTCPESPFEPVRRGRLTGKTIVLDPGHGGTDAGARFAFRDGFVLEEKEVVLDVSQRLRDLLTAEGATVHLTRCRDLHLDRMVRAGMANAVKPDVFVSVHVNGSPKRRKDGTEIYYFQRDGERLANYLLGSFTAPALWETLSTRRTLPNRSVHRRQFDVLTFTLAPAALTESLFMTNPIEARLLRDTRRSPAARRQQIALGHLHGILNYFGARKSPARKPTARIEPGYRPPRDAEVTITAVGDIALGGSPGMRFDGGAASFASVGRYLAGDLVIGNLEGALALGGRSKCSGGGSPRCFAFRAPPWYAEGLKGAGFNLLNLANNHSSDFGAEGTAETIAALDGAGLLHTGRHGQVARLRVGPVRVAIAGFAPYSSSQNLLDISGASRLVRRADAWADLVIVVMHAGGEGRDWVHVAPGAEVYLGEPRGDPVAFARAVVNAGADLVVGHGPHVLRGMQWYRGRLIAYSLGNFAAENTLSVRGRLGVGAILHATLRADGSWRRGRVAGVRLVGEGRPEVDPNGAGLRLVQRLSREDFGSSAARVSPKGQIQRPRPPPLGPTRSRSRTVADLTSRDKAALLVVSGSPVPPGAGAVFIGSRNLDSPRPRDALVFTDQEGGPVKAFSDIPPWAAASEYTDARWAFAEGRATGEALRWSGVHVDLAPVLDAGTGPLGDRHFRKPAYALAFARGLAAGGTGACVKHFPGLGFAPVSTDVASVHGTLRRSELARFRAAIRAGVRCVMVSHAVYPGLGNRPASLDPAAYRLLRRLGFRGVTITDDLDVLGREEAARSARLAVAAGADLVLFTSGEDAERAIDALVPLARRGDLDDSVARVLRLRRFRGLR